MDPRLFLLLMGLSQHFPEAGFNQFNPGAGLEWHPKRTPVHLSIGAYWNSFRRVSAFVSAGLEKQFDLPAGFKAGVGIEGGPVTGYELPFALIPYLVATKDGRSVKAFIIPPDPSSDKPALAIGLQGRIPLP